MPFLLRFVSISYKLFYITTVHELQEDIRHQFFVASNLHQIQALPIIGKIRQKTLNLSNYLMGKEICQSLKESIAKGQVYFNRIILERNGIIDEAGADIMSTLYNLLEVKSLVYIRNDFSLGCLEALKPIILTKSIPHHLEELRLVHCGRLSSAVTGRLLDVLIQKS
jgi:hypothetical protein